MRTIEVIFNKNTLVLHDRRTFIEEVLKWTRFGVKILSKKTRLDLDLYIVPIRFRYIDIGSLLFYVSFEE